MNKIIFALVASLSISLASAEEVPVRMTVNAGKSLGDAACRSTGAMKAGIK